MSKNSALKVGNSLLAISFAVQLLSGFLMDSGHSFISEVHEINPYVLATLLILHLSLNWGWIKINVLKIKPGAKA